MKWLHPFKHSVLQTISVTLQNIWSSAVEFGLIFNVFFIYHKTSTCLRLAAHDLERIE